MSTENNEIFRNICDTFTIGGLQNVLNVMVFNNGMKSLYIEGTTCIKVKYGIRIRYLDREGKRKCVTGYGTVMFFGTENIGDCPRVSVGLETDYSTCGNFVQVTAKIILKNQTE